MQCGVLEWSKEASRKMEVKIRSVIEGMESQRKV